MSLPSLSAVIPVYNEPDWIALAVSDLVVAVERSSFDEVELVIVDDGSDAETQEALRTLRTPFSLRVVRQENAGRFAARRRGLEEAGGELVLFLDSRVSVHPEALRFVADRLDGELPAWNGHVEIELQGNPYACFWNVVSHVAFREYLKEPRTTSFGLAEYDRFPKGTTLFLGPRAALEGALLEFRSHYSAADAHHVNDDTVLLRSLAAKQRINISPGFACTYRSRTNLRSFLRHAFHRGTVFFDGFARPGTRYLPVVVGFFPASLAAIAFVKRYPQASAAAIGAAPALAAAGASALGRPASEAASFGMLAPPFTVVFAAGIWRGAWLALRGRLAR